MWRKYGEWHLAKLAIFYYWRSITTLSKRIALFTYTLQYAYACIYVFIILWDNNLRYIFIALFQMRTQEVSGRYLKEAGNGTTLYKQDTPC